MRRSLGARVAVVLAFRRVGPSAAVTPQPIVLHDLLGAQHLAHFEVGPQVDEPQLTPDPGQAVDEDDRQQHPRTREEQRPRQEQPDEEADLEGPRRDGAEDPPTRGRTEPEQVHARMLTALGAVGDLEPN